MIKLSDFVKYKKQVLEGQIDEKNLQFKIDSWFQRDKQSKEKWNNFIEKCTSNHQINNEDLNNFYDSFSSSKQFVDYINDNVGYNDNEVNYKDQFLNIIRLTAGI